MSADKPIQIHATGEATGLILAPGNNGKPITVIGTAAIRGAFDAKCIEQALNSRGAPGVTDLVLNPDAHAGYGAPVGCAVAVATWGRRLCAILTPEPWQQCIYTIVITSSMS